MPTPTYRASSDAAIADIALRGAQLAKLSDAVAICWPHFDTLSAGEQRLLRVCQWSLAADKPITDEQFAWLDDIVRRVTPKPVAA